jgi:uncharacterized membrane protein
MPIRGGCGNMNVGALIISIIILIIVIILIVMVCCYGYNNNNNNSAVQNPQALAALAAYKKGVIGNGNMRNPQNNGNNIYTN